MPKIVPIVEGKGEVTALPKLLYRLLKENQCTTIHVGRLQNAGGCGNLKKPGGLEKFLRNAMIQADCSAILILMDADGACPEILAQDFASRVRTAGTPFPTVIVIANSAYEAWFLASLETIAGQALPGGAALPADLKFTGDIEAKRSPGDWLKGHLPAGYTYNKGEDQSAFTQMIDIELAKANSRSFRRLCHAVEEIIAAIDSGTSAVTPSALEAR